MRLTLYYYISDYGIGNDFKIAHLYKFQHKCMLYSSPSPVNPTKIAVSPLCIIVQKIVHLQCLRLKNNIAMFEEVFASLSISQKT